MSTDSASSGKLRRMFTRLTTSTDVLDAEQLQTEAVSDGGTPIETCCDREMVNVCGTLRTVTLRPRAGVPALEAELYDGSGSVSLIWLGRRQIAGVEPGRAIRVYGRMAKHEGHAVIYNPRYELRPGTAR